MGSDILKARGISGYFKLPLTREVSRSRFRSHSLGLRNLFGRKFRGSNVGSAASLPTQQPQPFQLDVSLDLPGSGITGIFGPSGCGKTTLLRCIAGLQRAEKGALSVNGETWQNADFSLPTYRRALGYVFQQPSLFPHLNVKDNLAFASKRAEKRPSSTFYQQILALMGIEPLLEQFPEQLSGGEQQRVAIARTLLIQPRLLLMDEPLASLDIERKQEILPYLENLHRCLEIPVLYVSHSIDEIARLADHLILMDSGSIKRAGPAVSLLSHPDFPLQSGEDRGALLETQVVEKDTRWGLMKVRFSGGALWLKDGGQKIGETLRVRILARDVSLTLTEESSTSILNRIPVEVQQVSDDQQPSMVLLQLRTGDGGDVEQGNTDNALLVARITRRSCHNLALKKGARAWAQIKSVAIVR